MPIHAGLSLPMRKSRIQMHRDEETPSSLSLVKFRGDDVEQQPDSGRYSHTLHSVA